MATKRPHPTASNIHSRLDTHDTVYVLFLAIPFLLFVKALSNLTEIQNFAPGRALREFQVPTI